MFWKSAECADLHLVPERILPLTIRLMAVSGSPSPPAITVQDSPPPAVDESASGK